MTVAVTETEARGHLSRLPAVVVAIVVALLALYPFAADVYSVSVLRDTLIFLCLGNGNGAYRCRRGRNPSPMLAEPVLQQAGVEAHE